LFTLSKLPASIPTRESFFLQHLLVIDDQLSSQELEDDLNILVNRRQPQCFR
jgi:hypothetical protein